MMKKQTRVALRRRVADLTTRSKVGASLPLLLGALDAARDAPADLSYMHDKYLYGARGRRARGSSAAPRRSPKR